jgi:hypothetical protein
MGIGEVRLEDRKSTLVRRNVERDRVDQAQEEAEVSSPAVQHVQAFVADAGEQRDEVGLDAQGDDPRHQRHSEHASTNSKRRGAKGDALAEERLRQEAV